MLRQCISSPILSRSNRLALRASSSICNTARKPILAQSLRLLSSQSSEKNEHKKEDSSFEEFGDSETQMSISHNFPDFIEKWSPSMFRKVGVGLGAISLASFPLVGPITGSILTALTGGYWYVGLKDLKQTSHAIRRNYPVMGNMRYILEVIRPELRQYIVESDWDGKPFDRLHRAQVYQRAKNVDDTLPFGTRRDLYKPNIEWACHSMFPEHVQESSLRTLVGSSSFGCKKMYSASRYNISAMSYGAISDHAILALSTGARYGKFFHDTGEGGVSRFHLEGGGDLVWNIGTGYFGCGSGTTTRMFDPDTYQKTLDGANGQVKMIEVKLSQGAKPGHGGLLPKKKINKEIAFSRKLPFPPESDCVSPPRHSAFSNSHELVMFLQQLRDLSGGLPIGIKMCMGHPQEFASLCHTIREIGTGPDFIVIDGAEGGTGAAPPEFSNSMGLPLEEGLTYAHNILRGTDLRQDITLAASGRITSAFGLVRALALGADFCNSARGFMFSLGCIQALKCNTNKCPTGIATTDPELMKGLDPTKKSVRVANFHRKTVHAAKHIAGAMGFTDMDQIHSGAIMRRVGVGKVETFAQQFPEIPVGSMLDKTAPPYYQTMWDNAVAANEK